MLSIALLVPAGCGPDVQTTAEPEGSLKVDELSGETATTASGTPQESLTALITKGAVVKKSAGRIVSIALVSPESAQVTDAELAELQAFADLETLNLMGCNDVTDEGIAQLAELHRLKRLFLGSGITDTGLRNLTSLSNLDTLSLSGCEKVTDDGLAHLTALPRLQVLLLGGTSITDGGVPHLSRLTGLKRLAIGETRISTDGIARLKAALPDCEILE